MVKISETRHITNRGVVKRNPEKKWSKPVFFSMISNSDFDKDIKEKIEKLHKGVMSVLGDRNRFEVKHSDYLFFSFSSGKDTQYRVHYQVRINKANTTWKELYMLVNSIKPVYYGTKWGD